MLFDMKDTRAIGLLTSKDLPKLIGDEQSLIKAFKGKGIECKPLVWNEPQVWSDYQSVIIRNPWDYFNHKDHFLNVLETISQQTKLLNPIDLVKWNLDKHYLMELQDKGIATIPTSHVTSIEHLKSQLQTLHYERFVLKPFVSAGAYKTFAFAKHQIPVEVEALDFVAEAFMLQPFLEEIQTRGEASLIYINGVFSHAIIKTPAPNDFRVQEDFGGKVEIYEPTENELLLSLQVIDNLPHKSLYARVDISWFNKLPSLMEVELVEPELFFRFSKTAAEKLVNSLETYDINVGNTLG
jgi:glutathione synthase/RimK-type ligase-like ATP-grasp enzyme